jgi:hypothetical protein
MPYVAVARRSGEGYVLTVEGLAGVTARVDAIEDAETVMRELLGMRLQAPPDSIDVRIRVVIED